MLVVPYDDGWPAAFARESDQLLRLFPPGTVSVHHIGSTSVPGLVAKPVIDILVEADDLQVIDRATAGLELLGFTAKGEYGIPGRRYFSRPATNAVLKVHLHAFQRRSVHVGRHLRFRDYLIAQPAAAVSYGALKQRLAAAHHDNATAYQLGKQAFIARMEAEAIAAFPHMLRCPDDATVLTVDTSHVVAFAACAHCAGVWFDKCTASKSIVAIAAAAYGSMQVSMM